MGWCVSVRFLVRYNNNNMYNGAPYLLYICNCVQLWGVLRVGLTASRGSFRTPCHITANHPFPFACSLAWSEKKVLKLIITYTIIENRVYITFKELKGECGWMYLSLDWKWGCFKGSHWGVQALLLSFSHCQQPFLRVCETRPLWDSLACFNFTFERCV